MHTLQRWAAGGLLLILAACAGPGHPPPSAEPSPAGSPNTGVTATGPVSPPAVPTATASPPVRACPSDVRGKVGPVLDPAALPALPSDGIVVDTSAGAVLVGLDGTVHGHLAGICIARPSGAPGEPPGPVALQSSDGQRRLLDPPARSLGDATLDRVPLVGGAALVDQHRVERAGTSVWELESFREVVVSQGRDIVSQSHPAPAASRALDLRSGSFRDLPPSCAATDRRGTTWYLVCDANATATVEALSPDGRRTKLLGSPVRPPGVGHWVSASLSPDGTRLLLQWSAECELPVAYLVPASGGQPVPAGGKEVESWALGWTPGSAAIVSFPAGACGGPTAQPGVFLLRPGAAPRLLYAATPGTEQFSGSAAHWRAL